MAYLLYSLSFFFLVLVGILYLSRAHWTPLLTSSISNLLPQRYSRLPSTFANDAASGLHSSTFDLTGNIEAGDSRAGLDQKGKNEVQRMMKTRGVGFDEARRLVVEERFRREGIGADGRPKDPKFVSFS